MAPEMGEYLVGAYLKLIEGCDFVDYGVRVPGGGYAGLNELDVVGIHFDSQKAYLCEVTTHLGGLSYGGGNKGTVQKIKQKHQNQIGYASAHLTAFKPVYMFWSPRVPVGYITRSLEEIQDLEKITNEKYKDRIGKLRELAIKAQQETGNPAFRMLQILGALRPKD